jgi:hypothetical protein
VPASIRSGIIDHAQRIDALDHQHVAADAADARAARVEEAAQVLDLGLHRRRFELRRALRQRRGQQHVRGAEHRRAHVAAEEQHVAARRARDRHVAVRHLDAAAEVAQALEVQVDRAVAEHAAARIADRRDAAPRPQRTENDEAGAHRAYEVVGRDVERLVLRLDLERAVVVPLVAHAEPLEDAQHVEHVGEARHVAQQHRAIDEQGRREDRQRTVLAAGDTNGAAETAAPPDSDSIQGEIPPRRRGMIPPTAHVC